MVRDPQPPVLTRQVSLDLPAGVALEGVALEKPASGVRTTLVDERTLQVRFEPHLLSDPMHGRITCLLSGNETLSVPWQVYRPQ